MFDVLVPLFNLQHLFGLYSPATQILILGPQGPSPEGLARELTRMVNTANPDKSLLHLTWDRDAEFLEDYARYVLGEAREGLVCFKVLECVYRWRGPGFGGGAPARPGSAHARGCQLGGKANVQGENASIEGGKRAGRCMHCLRARYHC